MDRSTYYGRSREIIWARSGGRCEVCGEPMTAEGKTFQAAHILPRTRGNLDKYGPGAIDSEENLKAVCCLECNAAAMITKFETDPEHRAHVAKLKAAALDRRAAKLTRGKR